MLLVVLILSGVYMIVCGSGIWPVSFMRQARQSRSVAPFHERRYAKTQNDRWATSAERLRTQADTWERKYSRSAQFGWPLIWIGFATFLLQLFVGAAAEWAGESWLHSVAATLALAAGLVPGAMLAHRYQTGAERPFKNPDAGERRALHGAVLLLMATLLITVVA